MIELVLGDITEQEVDVIVNAANADLLPGGGVCGAIFNAAGDDLIAECDELTYCDTGDVVITDAFDLEVNGVQKIIHAVGPIWDLADPDTNEALLTSAYENAIDKADELGLKSIAFPSISTGIYKFPIYLAALLAMTIMVEREDKLQNIETIRFVLFTEKDLHVYEAALELAREAKKYVDRTPNV
jgi:O-acetyl-ADP-ribose deacetylase (regulator of RNase III)